MNREIKFRAWHKELKEMFYNCSVDNRGWKNETTHFGGDNSTIMQYTGLKDKNGKEIYEGDICNLFMWAHEDEVGEIIFDNGCFSVKYYEHNDKDASIFNIQTPNLIEVIGNIYENPELMEV